MRSIKSLAELIGRPQEERTLLSSPSSVYSKLALLATAVVAIMCLLVPNLFSKFGHWSKLRPIVEIPKTSWRAIYEPETRPCPKVAAHSPECLASPQNPQLWRSPFLRSSDAHFAKVRSLKGLRYWIGAQLDSMQRSLANRQGANNLILGYINGTYRIWINGDFRFEGTYQTVQPIIIQLTSEEMNNASPTYIAIEIENSDGSPFPDYLNGSKGEGLISAEQADQIVTSESFDHITLHFSFFLVNFLVATLFLCFWMSVKSKQEYAYLSIFCLVQALMQLRLVIVVAASLGAEMAYSLDILIRLSGANFGLFLGLAFARARRSIFQVGIPVLMSIGPIALLRLHDPSAKLAFMQIINQYVSPTLYSLGAFACVLQAVYIALSPTSATRSKTRTNRLLYFALGLLFMALTYAAQAHGIGSHTKIVTFYRYIHLGIVFLFAWIVLSDYREQDKIINRSHLSKYHRRPGHIESVWGVFLQIDLKRSTKIAQELTNGSYGTLVNTWYSSLCTIATRHGAEVLMEEGDCISFFFDLETHRLPHRAAIETLGEMLDEQNRLTDFFELKRPICVRGSIVSGDLQPIWKATGSARKPGYAGQILIDSKRIMDLEYQIPKNEDRCLILMEEHTLEVILQEKEETATDIVTRGLNLQDKDGKQRVVAVLEYQPASAHRAIGLSKSA